MCFPVSSLLIRLEFDHGDTLTIIRTASSSVDKWWVVSVDVEMHVVYEETFSHCYVAIVISVHVESEKIHH